MDYLGYSLEDINSLLHYNPETGKFTSKISGKEIVDRNFSYRDRKTNKVACFNLARVAVMLVEGRYLGKDDLVACKDGDRYNLAYSNLVVATKKECHPTRNDEKPTYLETDEEHIFMKSDTRLFVVRRGPEQAIYRTYSKEEAVEVRDRWLDSGKILHEWDKTMPKMFQT